MKLHDAPCHGTFTDWPRPAVIRSETIELQLLIIVLILDALLIHHHYALTPICYNLHNVPALFFTCSCSLSAYCRCRSHIDFLFLWFLLILLSFPQDLLSRQARIPLLTSLRTHLLCSAGHTTLPTADSRRVHINTQKQAALLELQHSFSAYSPKHQRTTTMVFSIKKSLAGPGYIILNIVRALNIISLTAVITASIVMLVKTFIVSQFYFFDGCSHVITASISIFLVISECGLFRGYFARNWPLLSHSSGFITLGLLMLMTGVSVLGNLNKEATSEKNLGKSFWQIVIAAGILVFIMGIINIVCSYLFRTKSVGVTARMVRAYGAVAPQKAKDILPSLRTPSVRSSNGRRSFSSPLPRDTLPSYYNHTPEMVDRSNTTSSRGGLNISGPVNNDPEQFAKFKGSDDIRRPDSAAHPAFQNRF